MRPYRAPQASKLYGRAIVDRWIKEGLVKEIKDGEKLKRTLRLPLRVTSAYQLDALIQQLQDLKSELAMHAEVEVTLELKD